MNAAKLNKDPKNRVFVIIPAYLRRKYNLLDFEEVEIDDDGEWIKMKPKRD